MPTTLAERIIEFSWDCAWCASFTGHLAAGIAAGYLRKKPRKEEEEEEEEEEAKEAKEEKEEKESAMNWMVSTKEKEAQGQEEAPTTPRNSGLADKENPGAFRLDTARAALCSTEPAACPDPAVAAGEQKKAGKKKKKRGRKKGRGRKHQSKPVSDSPALHGSPAQSMDL